MKIKTIDLFKIPEGIQIPYFGGLLYRIATKVQRNLVEKIQIESLCLSKEIRKEKIIVSLTSFPARINVVGYAIKTLFNQTVKPDRIILWLAKDQFPDFRIPELLEKLSERGLEIKFCDDLRSHKKYHYALKNQKENEIVITYDDDIIYPEDSIERLLKKHIEYPECIVCNRAAACKFYDEKLSKYNEWSVYSTQGVNSPSTLLFPSTGGGTLYPFGSVDEEAFNIEAMKATAFTADDLWMRFMSAKKGTKIIKTRKNHRTFSTISGSQIFGLQNENCLGGENDRAIARLSEKYPDALKEIIMDGKSK